MATVAQAPDALPTTIDGGHRWAAFAPLIERLSDPANGNDRMFDAATAGVVDAIMATDADAMRAIAAGLRRVQATWKLAGEGADTAGYARVRQLLATTMTALRRVPSQSAVEVAADSWAHKMLHALSRRGDMRSAELLNLLDAHPSEISRTGGRLEQRGMVARARAGKETWWSITNRGRAALARVDAAASPQRLLEVRGPDMDDAMARLEDAVSKVTAHRQRVQLIVAELLVAQIGELDRRIAMWKGPREFMQDAPEYRMLTPGLPTDANRTFLWETLADVVDSARLEEFRARIWPVAPPVHDAYAVVHGSNGRRGLVFIEARTSPAEFKQAPFVLRNKAKARGLQHAMSETRESLAATGRWSRFPDPAVRLAFQHHLQTHCDVPVWHIDVCLVSAPEHSRLSPSTPGSEEEWLPHIDGVRKGLGLPDNHRLASFLRHEFMLESGLPNQTGPVPIRIAATARDDVPQVELGQEPLAVASTAA